MLHSNQRPCGRGQTKCAAWPTQRPHDISTAGPLPQRLRYRVRPLLTRACPRCLSPSPMRTALLSLVLGLFRQLRARRFRPGAAPSMTAAPARAPVCKRSCAVDQLTRERRWLVSSLVSTLGWSSPRSRLDASQDQRQAARQCNSARSPCAAPAAVCSLPMRVWSTDSQALATLLSCAQVLAATWLLCCAHSSLPFPLPQPGLAQEVRICHPAFDGAAVLRWVASSALPRMPRMPRNAQVSAAQHS